MLGLEGLLLNVALLLGGPVDPPAVTADAFQGWFQAATRGELHVPGPVAGRAGGFRYVFVGGFRIGRMPGYFSQNAAELRALGVPRRSIHMVFPNSHKTVDENRDAVRDELDRIAEIGPEPLVVIAHSRGACDVLAFALDEPEFVRERVAALFLIQGAFGGTALADYVLGEGEPMDDRMPPIHRWLARAIGAFERLLLKCGKHDALAGLGRIASRAYWRQSLADHAAAVPDVGPKVFYLQSRARPSRLGLFSRAMAWYLGAYYGPNDGVIALADQMVPGLGTSLGVLEAGHAELTRRAHAPRAPRNGRRALIQSIVMAVGQDQGSDVGSTATAHGPHRHSDW